MISPYLKVELVSNVFAKNMSLAIRMRSLGNELIKILPKQLNQRYFIVSNRHKNLLSKYVSAKHHCVREV